MPAKAGLLSCCCSTNTTLAPPSVPPSGPTKRLRATQEDPARHSAEQSQSGFLAIPRPTITISVPAASFSLSTFVSPGDWLRNAVCSSAWLRTPCGSKSPRSCGRGWRDASSKGQNRQTQYFRSGVFDVRASDEFSTGLRPLLREDGRFFGRRRVRLRVFREAPSLGSERSPSPCQIIIRRSILCAASPLL